MPNYTYKVEYIYTSKEKGKWYQNKNQVDGWTLAKEMEALLLEYESKGYELDKMSQIVSAHSPDGMTYGTKTDGLLLVLKKLKTE